MSDVFEQYAEYYDLIYQDKDYAAETGYIDSLIEQHHPGARRVVEFGSGTGRHGTGLAHKGYRVHGIERSPGMMAYGERCRGGQEIPGDGAFTQEQGDVAEPLNLEPADVALSLFHVVSYLTTTAQLRGLFANAARNLVAGGHFIFDLWYGPAVLHQRPEVRVKRMENETHRLTRLAEPGIDATRNLVTVAYTFFLEEKASGTISSFREEHVMRYLFDEEIEDLAAEAGFRVEGREEWMTRNPPSQETWSLCFILGKVE